jgi:uncharacterized protein (DUF58 family)
MWYRRLIYGGLLIAVLLFQITNENYLAQFLLCLCIALPLLSLALSLPGMLKCRLNLFPEPSALNRGEQGGWALAAESPAGLPLARISLRLTEENLLTGRREVLHVRLTGVARRLPTALSAPTEHCGLLELRADKARVCDYLGLFTLKLGAPPPARMLCRPIPAQCPPVEAPDGQGLRPSSKNTAKRGPGEDYELREYRPGDPMRAVHWKLSSKWDELIVRERSDTVTPLPLLTMDYFGKPEELDRLLDRITGMSRALLNVQRPHAVLWLDSAGEPQLQVVSDEKEYGDCLLALLSRPVPSTGPRLDDFPELIRGSNGPVFRVHITLEGGDGYGG